MFRALLDCEVCKREWNAWIAQANKRRAVITAINRGGKHPFDHEEVKSGSKDG